MGTYLEIIDSPLHGGKLGAVRRYPLLLVWDRGLLPKGTARLYFDTEAERAEYARKVEQDGNYDTVLNLSTITAWEPIAE